jgi:hypothetical protein
MREAHNEVVSVEMQVPLGLHLVIQTYICILYLLILLDADQPP